MSALVEALAGALVLLVLVVLALSLAALAGRLDRMHRRVEGASVALDAALLRRSVAAERLALSGTLDPATALLLAGAVDDAQAALPGPARERAESDLSQLLRAVLDPAACAALSGDPAAVARLADLCGACERVVLARRFANDAVVQAQRLRRKRLVRWAHLAGRAGVPATIELDDEPPPALVARAAPSARHPHPAA